MRKDTENSRDAPSKVKIFQSPLSEGSCSVAGEIRSDHVALMLHEYGRHIHAVSEGTTVFPVRLEPWMEAVGHFHDLRDDEGYIIAKIGPASVALPSELKEKLKDCIGQRIGIIRTDVGYRFRVIG